MRARQAWALGAFGAALAIGGCGATDDLLPGELDFIPSAVREACDGVMDDGEMLAGLTAAKMDQLNGYTEAEELSVARQSCALQLVGETSVDECVACKSAILDEVYGL